MGMICSVSLVALFAGAVVALLAAVELLNAAES